MGLLGTALTVGAGIAGLVSNANRSRAASSAIAQAESQNFAAQMNFKAENDRKDREFRQLQFDKQLEAKQKARAIASTVGTELNPELNRINPLIATSVFGDQTEPNIGRRKFLSNIAKPSQATSDTNINNAIA